MGLQQKRLVYGHDIHQFLARLHHAAHGLHRQPHHLPGHGRLDLQPLQICLDCDELFGVRQHLARHFAQLRFYLFAVLLLAHDDPLTQLCHCPARTVHVAQKIGDGGVRLRYHPLQLQLAIARCVAFRDHGTGIGQLFAEQRELAAAAHQHRFIGPQLCLRAFNAFFDAL